MNKITRLLLAVSIALLSGIAQAQAESPLANGSQFAGPYVGFKLGLNHSNASGAIDRAAHNTAFPGFTAGYNVDVERLVIGAEAFADLHNGSSTGKDGGIDAKFGLPFQQIMPYARIGFTAQEPSTRFHWGLGVEYKFARHVSALGEWTTDWSNHDGTQRRNNSYTVGLQYHFN